MSDEDIFKLKQHHMRLDEGSPCGVQGIPDSPLVHHYRKSRSNSIHQNDRKVPVLNLDFIYDEVDPPRY